MSEAGPQVNGLVSSTGKYIDHIDPDDPEYIKNLQRPAEVKEDLQQMENRSRVKVILNSQAFKEELEQVVEEQLRNGPFPTSLIALQQITDLLLPHSKGGLGSLARASAVIPINDLRGVESQSFAKGERLLRCKLAALYRLVDLCGWSHGIYNHITARVSSENEHFLLNPFGLTYSEVTASTLLKVDVNGEVLDSGSTQLGPYKSGFLIHAAIHQARPDVRCIVHLHSPAAVAVSALKCGLIPMSHEALLCGNISYHDFQGISMDAEERDKLARNLGVHNKVLILRNRGVLSCGETVEEAFHYTFNVMAACEAQVKALPLGLDNILIPSEEAREAHKAASLSAADPKERKWKTGELEFEALMRTLDNSGYRTGYPYKMPVVKQERKDRSNSEVEIPPSSSSFTYIFDGDYVNSKYASPLQAAKDRQKIAFKAGWLTTPNAYKKTEIDEIGTTTPKKITKWVPEGDSTSKPGVAPIKIENPNQFAPQGANPKEYREKQKSIKKDYYEEKVTAGPQSRILEGITWDEAQKVKDGQMSASGDQLIVVGAASKGIIQRDHQHNAVVYRQYYAANPFENMSEAEIAKYQSEVQRKERGEPETVEEEEVQPPPVEIEIPTIEQPQEPEKPEPEVVEPAIPEGNTNILPERITSSEPKTGHQTPQKEKLLEHIEDQEVCSEISAQKPDQQTLVEIDHNCAHPSLTDTAGDQLIERTLHRCSDEQSPNNAHTFGGDDGSDETSIGWIGSELGSHTSGIDSGSRHSAGSFSWSSRLEAVRAESCPENEFVRIQLNPMELYHGRNESGVMKARFSVQSTVRRLVRAELSRGGDGAFEEVCTSISEPFIEHFPADDSYFEHSVGLDACVSRVSVRRSWRSFRKPTVHCEKSMHTWQTDTQYVAPEVDLDIAGNDSVGNNNQPTLELNTSPDVSQVIGSDHLDTTEDTSSIQRIIDHNGSPPSDIGVDTGQIVRLNTRQDEKGKQTPNGAPTSGKEGERSGERVRDTASPANQTSQSLQPVRAIEMAQNNSTSLHNFGPGRWNQLWNKDSNKVLPVRSFDDILEEDMKFADEELYEELDAPAEEQLKENLKPDEVQTRINATILKVDSKKKLHDRRQMPPPPLPPLLKPKKFKSKKISLKQKRKKIRNPLSPVKEEFGGTAEEMEEMEAIYEEVDDSFEQLLISAEDDLLISPKIDQDVSNRRLTVAHSAGAAPMAIEDDFDYQNINPPSRQTNIHLPLRSIPGQAHWKDPLFADNHSLVTSPQARQEQDSADFPENDTQSNSSDEQEESYSTHAIEGQGGSVDEYSGDKGINAPKYSPFLAHISHPEVRSIPHTSFSSLVFPEIMTTNDDALTTAVEDLNRDSNVDLSTRLDRDIFKDNTQSEALSVDVDYSVQSRNKELGEQSDYVDEIDEVDHRQHVTNSASLISPGISQWYRPSETIPITLGDTFQSMRTGINHDRTTPSMRTETDFDRNTPAMRTETNIERTTPSMRTETDFERTIPSMRTEADFDRTIPSMRTQTDIDRTIPLIRTKTDIDRTIPLIRTKTNIDRTIPLIRTKTNINRTIPSMTTDSNIERTNPSMRTETNIERTYPSMRTETNIERALPSMRTETDFERTLPSMRTLTDFERTLPSMRTETDFERTLPSMRTETDFERTIPSMRTETDFERTIPSMRTETDFDRNIPSMRTVTDFERTIPSNRTDTNIERTIPSMRTDTNIERTIPSMRTETDFERTIPSMRTETDFERTIPSMRTETDFDRNIPSMRTETDFERTIPSMRTETNIERTIPSMRTDTNIERTIPSMRTETDFERTIPSMRTETNIERTIPSMRTDTNIERTIPSMRTETDFERTIPSMRTETDFERTIPSMRTETDFERTITSMRTDTNIKRTIPSMRTQTDFERTLPSMRTETDFERTLPSMRTETDFERTLPSMRTETDFDITIPSMRTETDFDRNIPSMRTVTDFERTIPSNRTDTNIERTIPSMRTDTNIERTIPSMRTDTNIERTIPSMRTETDFDRNIPSMRTETDFDRTIPSMRTETDFERTIPSIRTEMNIERTIPSMRTDTNIERTIPSMRTETDFERTLPSMRTETDFERTLPSMRTETDFERTLPSMRTETDFERTLPSMRTETDFERTLPSMRTETDFERTFPSMRTETDFERTIPSMRTETDFERTIPSMRTETDFERTIPSMRTETDFDRNIPSMRTETDFERTIPSMRTETDFERTLPSMRTETDFERTLPSMRTETDFERTIPSMRTETDFDRTLPSMRTETYFERTIPSMRTETDFERTIPSMRTETDFERTIPSMRTETDFDRNIPSMRTETNIERTLPSMRTETDFYRTIPSMRTEKDIVNTVPSRKIVTYIRDTIPSRKIETDIKDTIPSRNTETDINSIIPSRKIETDIKDTIPSRKIETYINDTIPSRKIETDIDDTFPSRKIETDINDTIPSRKIVTDIESIIHFHDVEINVKDNSFIPKVALANASETSAKGRAHKMKQKNMLNVDEGPVQTSSPKMGRARSKESPFKPYLQKLGKSEETLLDIMPLAGHSPRINWSQDQLKYIAVDESVKLPLARSKSLGPHHVNRKNQKRFSSKHKETLVDDFLDSGSPGEGGFQSPRAVLDQYNLMKHSERMELSSSRSIFKPSIVRVDPVIGDVMPPLPDTTEVPSVSDSEGQPSSPSSSRAHTRRFIVTSSDCSAPKQRWVPKQKRERQRGRSNMSNRSENVHSLTSTVDRNRENRRSVEEDSSRFTVRQRQNMDGGDSSEIQSSVSRIEDTNEKQLRKKEQVQTNKEAGQNYRNESGKREYRRESASEQERKDGKTNSVNEDRDSRTKRTEKRREKEYSHGRENEQIAADVDIIDEINLEQGKYGRFRDERSGDGNNNHLVSQNKSGGPDTGMLEKSAGRRDDVLASDLSWGMLKQQNSIAESEHSYKGSDKLIKGNEDVRRDKAREEDGSGTDEREITRGNKEVKRNDRRDDRGRNKRHGREKTRDDREDIIRYEREETRKDHVERVRRNNEEEIRRNNEEEIRRNNEEEIRRNNEEEIRRNNEEEIRRNNEEEIRRNNEEEIRRNNEEEIRRNNEEEIRRNNEEEIRRNNEEEIRRNNEEEIRRNNEEEIRRNNEEEIRRNNEEEIRRNNDEEIRRNNDEEIRRNNEEEIRRNNDEEIRRNNDEEIRRNNEEEIRRNNEEEIRNKIRRDDGEEIRRDKMGRIITDEKEETTRGETRRDEEEETRRDEEEETRRDEEEETRRDEEEETRRDEEEETRRDRIGRIRRGEEEETRRDEEEETRRDRIGRIRRGEEEETRRDRIGRIRRDEEEETRVHTKGRIRRDEEEETRVHTKGRIRRDEEEEIRRHTKGRIRRDEEEETRVHTKGRIRRDEEEEIRRHTKGRIRRDEEEETRVHTKGRIRRDEEEETRSHTKGRIRRDEEEETRVHTKGRIRRDEEEETRRHTKGRLRKDEEEGIRRERSRRDSEEETRQSNQENLIEMARKGSGKIRSERETRRDEKENRRSYEIKIDRSGPNADKEPKYNYKEKGINAFDEHRSGNVADETFENNEESRPDGKAYHDVRRHKGNLNEMLENQHIQASEPNKHSYSTSHRGRTNSEYSTQGIDESNEQLSKHSSGRIVPEVSASVSNQHVSTHSEEITEKVLSPVDVFLNSNRMEIDPESSPRLHRRRGGAIAHSDAHVKGKDKWRQDSMRTNMEDSSHGFVDHKSTKRRDVRKYSDSDNRHIPDEDNIGVQSSVWSPGLVEEEMHAVLRADPTSPAGSVHLKKRLVNSARNIHEVLEVDSPTGEPAQLAHSPVRLSMNNHPSTDGAEAEIRLHHESALDTDFYLPVGMSRSPEDKHTKENKNEMKNKRHERFSQQRRNIEEDVSVISDREHTDHVDEILNSSNIANNVSHGVAISSRQYGLANVGNNTEDKVVDREDNSRWHPSRKEMKARKESVKVSTDGNGQAEIRHKGDLERRQTDEDASKNSDLSLSEDSRKKISKREAVFKTRIKDACLPRRRTRRSNEGEAANDYSRETDDRSMSSKEVSKSMVSVGYGEELHPARRSLLDVSNVHVSDVDKSVESRVEKEPQKPYLNSVKRSRSAHDSSDGDLTRDSEVMQHKYAGFIKRTGRGQSKAHPMKSVSLSDIGGWDEEHKDTKYDLTDSSKNSGLPSPASPNDPRPEDHIHDFDSLIHENPIEVNMDDSNEGKPARTKKGILRYFSCVGGKSSSTTRKTGKYTKKGSTAYYEEGEKRKIKKLSRQKTNEEESSYYFEESGKDDEHSHRVKQSVESSNVYEGQEQFPITIDKPSQLLPSIPKVQRYQKGTSFQPSKPLSTYVDPSDGLESLEKEVSSIDDDYDEDNNDEDISLGWKNRRSAHLRSQPEHSGSQERELNQFSSFGKANVAASNSKFVINKYKHSKLDSAAVTAHRNDSERIATNVSAESLDEQPTTEDSDKSIEIEPASFSHVSDLQLQAGSEAHFLPTQSSSPENMKQKTTSHVQKANRDVHPQQSGTSRSSLADHEGHISPTKFTKRKVFQHLNASTDVTTPAALDRSDSSDDYPLLRLDSSAPAHFSIDKQQTSRHRHSYGPAQEQLDGFSESHHLGSSYDQSFSFDSPDLQYKRHQRTVSVDAGVSRLQRRISETSIGTESNISRPRSVSSASNPLIYEPWRVKADKRKRSMSISEVVNAKGVARTRSVGEICNSTVASSVARRRAKSRLSSDITSRMYQPRQHRRSHSLGNTSFGSLRPSRQHSFSGFDHSTRSSVRSPEHSDKERSSESEYHSCEDSDASLTAVTVKRSESDRQPSQSYYKPQLPEEKPAVPLKSDTLKSTDSASGGETLEERSSKEGSPTKEHLSPTKEKKKKKKFHIPSFSKKKSKDSKESAA